MSGLNKYALAAIVTAMAAAASSVAWAGIESNITVPEPGLFGLVAAGAAAVIVAARLRHRK